MRGTAHVEDAFSAVVERLALEYDEPSTNFIGFDNRLHARVPGYFMNAADVRYIRHHRNFLSWKAVVALNLSTSVQGRRSLVALNMGLGDLYTVAVRDGRVLWSQAAQYESIRVHQLIEW